MFDVRQPPRTPAYLLHYSSFTPRSSGQKLYFVSHNKSSSKVPRNLKSCGTVTRLGAFFLSFLCRLVENENPFIFVGKPR